MNDANWLDFLDSDLFHNFMNTPQKIIYCQCVENWLGKLFFMKQYLSHLLQLRLCERIKHLLWLNQWHSSRCVFPFFSFPTLTRLNLCHVVFTCASILIFCSLWFVSLCFRCRHIMATWIQHGSRIIGFLNYIRFQLIKRHPCKWLWFRSTCT